MSDDLSKVDWGSARLKATKPGSRPNHLPVVHNRAQALAVAHKDERVAEAFWAKVDRTGGVHVCWPWRASAPSGYGQHSIKFTGGFRLAVNAHRFAYELINGACGEAVLDHLCRNTRCCNPRHLEPVTVRMNTIRGVSPVGLNAQKTHCRNGHPLSGDNLITVKTPGRGQERKCRICTNKTHVAYRLRKATRALERDSREG